MGGSSSPLSVGSFLNGIGTNLVAGGNPITGALMNASMLAGSGGATNPTVGSFSPDFMNTGKVIQSAPAANNALNETFLQRIGGTGNIFGQGGLMSQAGQGLSVYNQANQAFGGNDAPMQMAPAGQVSRGQIQPMDYMSLLNPQQQSVIRPPQISLLG
jgi:hypothetical protein